MPPDPVRIEETAAWLRKGRKDMWRAEMMLRVDPPDTEDCLFHCQQAAEKALKALLVWHDHPFRRTHDLVELGTQCADLEPTLKDVILRLGPLTRFAWEYRYPGEAASPPVDATRQWVACVGGVLTAVESLLPPEVR